MHQKRVSKMRVRASLYISLILTSCALSGCVGIGRSQQVVETKFVIIHQGKPLQCLENVTILGRTIDGEQIIGKQKIGGWVLMPPEHWQVVKNGPVYLAFAQRPFSYHLAQGEGTEPPYS